MSRVGKRPIAIPQGVSVNVAGASVQVKGPKGQLSQAIPAPIRARVDGAEVKLERPDDRQDTRSLHGLARALVANMIRGVTAQFSKELEQQGIRQIISRPKHPQTLGKIERFWGTLWRECLQRAVFLDLEDARRRVGLFIDHYNFQRPHQGLEGLTPGQAAATVLAYEPVWAIGTGQTCDPAEADRVCGVIRDTAGRLFGADTAGQIRVEYGGSVKPDNARELLAKPNIDGALVGGACLKADDFAAIIRAAL